MSISINLQIKDIEKLNKSMESHIKKVDKKINNAIVAARNATIEDAKLYVDTISSKYAGMHEESLERPSDHIKFERFQNPLANQRSYTISVSGVGVIGESLLGGAQHHDLPVSGMQPMGKMMPMRYPEQATIKWTPIVIDHPGIENPIGERLEQHISNKFKMLILKNL